MKLATMKIVCLLALVGGMFMLGLVFDIGYAQLAHERALEYWPRQESGALNLRMPGVIAGTILVVVGLYGLLPKLRSSRNATITFKGANGDIVLQLRPIRKLLLKMMRRMPEVYAIKLNVRPDNDGRRACIDADVVLQNCAALGARQSAKIVAECLATTARGLLGLEDLSSVRINVKGIQVDVAATSKQIREHLAQKMADEASTYALAHPPIAAVTLDNGDASDDQSEELQDTDIAEAETESEEEQASEQEQESQASITEQEMSLPQAPEYKSVPAPAEAAEPEEAPVASACDEAHPVALDDVELPHLVDRDVSLPPAPQINDYGEIAPDEPADIGDGYEGAEQAPEPEKTDNIEPAP